MKKKINCLLIGHNDMDFEKYEKAVRDKGTNKGAFRDLEKNYVRYHKPPYHAMQMFNLFSPPDCSPISMGDSFSNAVAYLGTYLSRRGLTFDYVHTFQEEKKELAHKLREEEIGAVAIITTYYVSVLPILEIIDFIKSHHSTVKIIVGGPFISTEVRTRQPEDMEFLFQSMGADFYVYSSQGEAALVEILRYLENSGYTSIEQIDNIFYKTDDGYRATRWVQEDNVLSQNMVNWELFSQRLGEYVNIRTSISCPFSCTFCSFPRHAGKHRTADLEAVKKELDTLDKIPGVKILNFIDDTFNVPPDRFKKLLKMMIKQKYRFNWVSYFRCQYADNETVELMKQSGCLGVFIGVESGSAAILKNMNKAATVEKYRAGIELLKKHDIVSHGSFLVGFPGETPDTVEDTMRFIKETPLDFYHTQLWFYERITPIWEHRETYGLQGDGYDWRHNTMDNKMASDLIDRRLFLPIEQPVWVPLYNFNFNTIWQLVLRGMDITSVKKFLTAFAKGMKEKIANPSQKEISFKVVNALREACSFGNSVTPQTNEKKTILDKDSVSFNF